MKEYFGEDNVILMPDIVLYLKDKINIKQKVKKEIGICFRDDKEEDITKIEEKNELLEGLKKYYVEKFDTYIPKERFIYEKRYDILKELLENISSYEIIYTDRLHAMIFAYLTNTKCVFIDNSNKKISETYNLWLKDNVNNIVENRNTKDSIEMIEKYVITNKEKSYINLFEDLKEKINLKMKEI